MTRHPSEDAPASHASTASRGLAGTSDAALARLTIDRFHLACTIAAGAMPAGGRVHAVSEGRSLGSLPVSALKGGVGRILFGPEAALREGQEVQLLPEDGRQAQPLASGRVATRVAGAIDRCSEALVRGWAANLLCPEIPLRLEILVNGEAVGTAVAERRRLDLERLGEGLGSSGFLFKFLPPLCLAPGRGTSVSVRIAGTGIELAHSPWAVSHVFDKLPAPVSSASVRREARRPA